MPQIISTNIASLNAQRNLNRSQSQLGVALQRLSSGLRINSAKDDAAGLAISERFTTQIRGINQAVRNANDGISLAQTGEGDLAQITNNLQRIRELAVQSANATNSSSDRAALQLEASQLISEIDRVASTSAFNGVKLLDGTFSTQQFQVGANSGEIVNISNISSARTDDLGQADSATLTNTTAVGSTDLVAGDLTINGNDIGAVTADAKSIADAITASATNVTASATNTQALAFTDVVGTAATAASFSFGSFTDIVNVGGGSQTASFSIDGQVITSGTDTVDTNPLITGAQIDGALTALDAADGSSDGNFTINGNVYTYVGTAASGGADLTISRADGTDFTVNSTSNTGGSAGFTNLAENAGDVATTNGVAEVAPDYNLSIDGSALDLSAYFGTGDVTITGTDVAAAINGLTGVTASFSGGNITITKDDGSNFTLSETGTDSTGAEGFADAAETTHRGYVDTIASTGADLVIAGNAPAKAGLTAGTTPLSGTLSGTTITNTDISTVNGANLALTSVDNALTTINNSRASLGAIQNRFESVVASLSASSENLSSARSRIRDADFAQETAALTRTQILQQAGVSILSQANSLPQLVLQLLQ
jgi:flagellin